MPGKAAAPGDLFVGLHVEKGVVGPKAEELFGAKPRGQRLIMTNAWLWHPFVEALRSGKIDAQAAAAEAAAGRPLTVMAIAATQPLPTEHDERPASADVDTVRFELSKGEATLISDQDKPLDLPAHLLNGFGRAKSLPEMAAKLGEVPDGEWAWIEFLIGIRFTVDPASVDAWSAGDIWANAAQPWRDWLR